MSHVDPADWQLPNAVSVDVTDLHELALLQLNAARPAERGSGEPE